MLGEQETIGKVLHVAELEALGADIDAGETANLEGLAADEERRLARGTSEEEDDAYPGPVYSSLAEPIVAGAMALAVVPFVQGFISEAGKEAFGALKRVVQRRTAQTDGVAVRNATGSYGRWEVLDSLPNEVKIIFLRDDHSGSVFEINDRVTVQALRELASPDEVAKRKPGGLYRWSKGRWRRARHT